MSVPFMLGLCAVLAAQPAAPSGERGFLGVGVAPANRESGDGVMIQDLVPDSPAAKAGLKAGDVLLKLNDKGVNNIKEFFSAVAAAKPGDKVKVQLRRDDKEQTISATLASWPGLTPTQPGLLKPPQLGIQAEPLNEDMKTRLKVKADAGAVVTEVIPNTPAAAAGLKRDDVITAVDGQVIKGPDDLRTAVLKVGVGKEVTLHIQRGAEEKTVKAALKAPAPSILPLPMPPFPDGGGFNAGNLKGLLDRLNKADDLERRIDQLEKRLSELERKLPAKK